MQEVQKKTSYSNASVLKDALPVQIGDSIMILEMQGEPSYTGKTGTVTQIDDANQIHGTWGGCAVIPGLDSFKKI